MATFRYPQNDFDSSAQLLRVMGSFWASTYQGNKVLQDLAGVTGQLAQQTYFDFLDLLRSISRYDLPVLHKKFWHALTIKESELLSNFTIAAQYTTEDRESCLSDAIKPSDSGYATDHYGKNNDLQYGKTINPVYYLCTKPADLAQVQAIHNGILAPSVSWVNGIDFYVDKSFIRLRENPFSNTLWPKRDILDAEGKLVDRECVLWLYQGEFDLNLFYEQFGYVLRLQLQSSQGYKAFVNAVFDSFVLGSNIKAQQQALAASFGVPLVVEAEETVEAIVKDAKVLNIITDRHVYQFPKESTAIVAVGDTVKAGDELTDVLQVFELNRGLTTQAIDALTLDTGLLACGFFKGITFENKETPTVVEENVKGHTKISWELGGFPYDVEKFWSDVHDAGIAKNKTLAHLLDKRSTPVSEPTAASLPTSINPLRFLVDNFLRNNAYVVKLRANINRRDKLKFFPIEQFKKAQPPHSVLLLIVELVHCDSPVIMEAAGTAEMAGYTEVVSGFPCMTTAETVDGSSAFTERVKVGTIGGRCV